jgi:hypothetical protein
LFYVAFSVRVMGGNVENRCGFRRFPIIYHKEFAMPEPAKRDPKAPRFLEITIKDSEGKVWSTIYAQNKDFSTGSVGYYASEKSTNPESGERYQCGMSFTLIGSKPGKE